MQDHRRTALVVLALMLLLPLTLAIAPPLAEAVSSTVVISQIYTVGGAPGASFHNDYVELFNAGTTSVDLSTWSLQVEVPGPMWEVIPLCGAIPHGRYYLVSLASGGSDGVPLPGPDCTGTTNLAGGTGKIALVSATGVLGASCPLASPVLVDFLGYGSQVNCSEGQPAASPNPTHALTRSPGDPCSDTDDNSADFALSTPNPRNAAAPGNGCNNTPPAVAPIPSQTADELALLTVVPSGSDANGDPIMWSGSNLPGGSNVATSTGEFSWTPSGTDAGSYSGITLAAHDGLGGSDSTSFDVAVTDATIPVVDPIPDQFVAEGGSVTVIATASDADGDPLSFSYNPPRSWITQTPMTSEFTIAPGYDVAGPGGNAFAVTVEASDGTNTGSASFTVHVVNVTTAANTPYAARTWTGVSPATGELSLAEDPDLCLGGPVPLCFRRYYASLLDREGEALGTMGANWLGSYDWRLEETPTTAKVVDPRGRVYRFASGGNGTWTLVGPRDAPYELTELGNEMSFTQARFRAFYILNRTTGTLSRIEDARGNVHTLSYVGGNLSTVSDGLGRTLTFTHDGPGRITSVTDGTRTVTYAYTGSNLASMTDAESKTTAYQYDLLSPISGLITAVVDASGGNPLQYQYGPDGRVSQVQLGGAASMTFQQALLSANQIGTNVQWPDGGNHSYVHDGFGRLTQYTDPQNGLTSWAYDAQGRPTSVTRPSTIVPVTIAYDPTSGFPSVLTLPDASEWQVSYVGRTFANGTLFFPSSIYAPDTGHTTFTYDGVGNLTAVTDQATQSWTITYNGFGQPLTVTTPTSGVLSYTYDGQGRRTSSNDGAGTTQFTYDGLDRLTTITNPDASTRTFTWNGRNQLLTATNELSKTWTIAYRDNGQPESITDPLAATTTLGYDARNRLNQITDALSGVTSVGYDPSWRVSSVTDPTSRVISMPYDLMGRLAGITDPDGHTTTYAYDADSRLITVTDPLSHSWSLGYDNRDRVTSVTDPLTNTTNYSYDPVGRLMAVNRPLGLNTTYTYDLRGLLTGATTGPVSVGYAYTPLRQLETFTDGEGNAWTRGYDAMGRLASTTDPLLRSTTFDYDARNRLTEITDPVEMATFDYDPTGRLTQRSYSDGTVNHYTYDDAGRLLTTEGATRTYDALGRVTEENGLDYTYDPAGRLLTETYAPGEVITHGYDTRGLLGTTTDWLSGATTFTHDAAGRLTRLSRPNGTTASYAYDATNRLLRLAETAPPDTNPDTICIVVLSRDALGRVTSADRRMPLQWAPQSATRSYSYDAASQIVGFTYDGLGRLLDDGVRTYAWDGASRADSINDGSTTRRYAWDGLNRITTTGKNTESGETVLLNGGCPVLRLKVARERTMPGGVETDRTHWVTTPGGLPLYTIDLTVDPPVRRYFHFDESGNTACRTNETGSIVTSYAYSPLGNAMELGELQPYPALTYKGELGAVQESRSGLYRAGGSFYDAQSAEEPGLLNVDIWDVAPTGPNSPGTTDLVTPGIGRNGNDNGLATVWSDLPLLNYFATPEAIALPGYGNSYETLPGYGHSWNIYASLPGHGNGYATRPGYGSSAPIDSWTVDDVYFLRSATPLLYGPSAPVDSWTVDDVYFLRSATPLLYGSSAPWFNNAVMIQAFDIPGDSSVTLQAEQSGMVSIPRHSPGVLHFLPHIQWSPDYLTTTSPVALCPGAYSSDACGPPVTYPFGAREIRPFGRSSFRYASDLGLLQHSYSKLIHPSFKYASDLGE